MWEQVNKIRGSEKSLNTLTVQHIDANTLNTHLASMSTDPSYKIPPTKATTINSRQHHQFTPYSVLHMLTKTCPSGTVQTVYQHDNDYDSRNEVNESIEKEDFNHETSNMGARMEPDQEDSVVVSEDEGSDCSTNATDDTKEGHDNQNRKVNKVLKMRFKRGMKQYLIHWADTDPTLDSWHFLNESFEGFHKEVKKFEDERKKLHLKGIGQSSDTIEKPAGKALSSSKQVKRAKHSWYYLSSSEDEDCMLKDNFWKNLDEGLYCF
ncbi:hypothetical protein HELRODRAFT_163900 [Helobdella robusta]|uniref:Chromo domain-containing protein n=1 Tax=Helobdella robusta TaxID=6412 RepID=T1EUL5_HELRO|nr:hypothetical protein HELRODRAFT_163900 [Helobdella robusta]ESN96777.1 hypothetical protein HELRODRAFT_163900 [Helobdella robusta]